MNEQAFQPILWRPSDPHPLLNQTAALTIKAIGFPEIKLYPATLLDEGYNDPIPPRGRHFVKVRDEANEVIEHYVRNGNEWWLWFVRDHIYAAQLIWEKFRFPDELHS